ncbi:hypothetical protein C0J52_14501 [Blattella germanica]|nr:hypothetical protein C0J52_14501 [Blattella germanica]
MYNHEVIKEHSVSSHPHFRSASWFSPFCPPDLSFLLKIQENFIFPVSTVNFKIFTHSCLRKRSSPREVSLPENSFREIFCGEQLWTMGLTGVAACIKYLIFVFNLLFLISGIAITTLGAIILGSYYSYEHVLLHGFISVSLLFIIVGVITVVLSFIGCCGAVKESHCMVILFSALLIVVFILELSGGIAGYILKMQTSDFLVSQLNSSMLEYNANAKSESTQLWNLMQADLHCCGVHNWRDWDQVFHNDSLPFSCCESVGNCTTSSPDIFPTGCVRVFSQLVGGNAGIIAGILIIGVGTTIKAIYSHFDTFLEDRFNSPATLLIVIGCIVFIVAFFGCCGAAPGLAGYLLKDGLKEYLVDRLNVSMTSYDKNAEIARTIDFMQERRRAIEEMNKGKSIKDVASMFAVDTSTVHYWKRNKGTSLFGGDLVIPNSCCVDTCSTVYGNGCLPRVQYVVERSAIMLASAAVSIALLQLLGVMFACSLGKSIRHTKTERERRRWELRESLLRKDSFYGDSSKA